LVGHSHGGSVIWHALVRSARASGTRLKGLQTWTTVGTPFLVFKPDHTTWRHLVGLLISGVALFLLRDAMLEGWTERASICREGDPCYVIATGLLFCSLIVSLVVFSLRVGRHIWDSIRSRLLLGEERKAADWYGRQWLGIWHDYDEPIAGLRASLAEPLQLL